MIFAFTSNKLRQPQNSSLKMINLYYKTIAINVFHCGKYHFEFRVKKSLLNYVVPKKF